MGAWLLGVCFLVTVGVAARPHNRPLTNDFGKDPNLTTWLTKKKARQIMRYHGANGIKITADRVYIKRAGHWICVYRNPLSVEGTDGRPDASASAAVHVARSRS